MNNYKENPPEDGIEVIAFNEAWIDEDYNPRGIRIGFKNNDDFISAHWWDYQSTYMTISHSDCDDNPIFSDNIRNNIEPTYWIEIQLYNE